MAGGALAASAPDSGTNWPSFRGPRAAGVAEGYPVPVEWNVPAGKNVLWRTSVPGLAHSSPVVWGERVFVTSAVRTGGESELSSLFGSPNYGDGNPLADEGEHAFEVLQRRDDGGQDAGRRPCAACRRRRWPCSPPVRRLDAEEGSQRRELLIRPRGSTPPRAPQRTDRSSDRSSRHEPGCRLPPDDLDIG
jgi:hypothetical protein